MGRRTGVFAGDFLPDAASFERCLDREIRTDEANRFANLEEIDDETRQELCTLVEVNSRLSARVLLGFLVADDGASRDEIIDYVDEVIVPLVADRRSASSGNGGRSSHD